MDNVDIKLGEMTENDPVNAHMISHTKMINYFSIQSLHINFFLFFIE